jgi:hypothetical protein
MVAPSTASPLLQVLVQTVIALRLEELTAFSVVGVAALVLKAHQEVEDKEVARQPQLAQPRLLHRITRVVAVPEEPRPRLAPTTVEVQMVLRG